ncbi:YceI family protein [Cellulomonas edaphi]|uniref:YceI family protein n=1 Tax=Cellulomonas edaphi TaxID=3053468 RepID=A0ABT7S6S0_9CELL|nr:YceI family protein [Cellulomons edaphi]MDM7831305.1 YceI family protein [Cellulomons edaphi]
MVAGAGVLLLGAGVLVGPQLYAAHANRAAAPVPSLTASPGLEGDLDGTWSIGSGSVAGYRVHEVLRGIDVRVTGRTPQVEGTVTVDDGELTAALLSVDMASIHTDEPPRDAYFRSSALHTSRFPTATFALTRAARLTDGGDAVLDGELTIHGVTRAVRVDAQAAGGSRGVDVVGSVPVVFADYGVKAPDLGFVKVDSRGAVEFSLHLVPESP